MKILRAAAVLSALSSVTAATVLGALATQAWDWTGAAPTAAQPFLPGIVAGPATEESMVSTSPDGQMLLWGASRLWFPVTRVSEIRISERNDGAWTPAVTAPFSRGFSDADPFPARDGSGVFLSSFRPVDGPPRKDFDLWFVPRTADGYGRAVNLGKAVNSPADELYASAARDGTLYFGSDRSGIWQIYRAQRKSDGSYSAAEALPEPVNLPGLWSFNPFISADGRTLLFTALNRPGGAGKGDIWVTRLDKDGTFGAPVNLGPAVNTAEEDYHATVTGDASALMFVRRDTSSPSGNAEAMWIKLAAVPALREAWGRQGQAGP
jgi:hypothetical protein